jgi:hypothetical protein
MSGAKRQHFSPSFRLCPTNSETVFMAPAVDLPAVNPYCSDGI